MGIASIIAKSGGFLLRSPEREIDEMLREGLGAGVSRGFFEPFDLFGLQNGREVKTDQGFRWFGGA